jgi:anti-sigma factor RsiW
MELNINPRAVKQDIRAIDAQIATLERSKGLLQSLLADLEGKDAPVVGKYQRRNTAQGDELRRQVYEVLTVEQPASTQAVAEAVQISGNTALKYLRQLQGDGRASEVSGNKRTNLAWVRTPMSVKPGEEVDLTK